MTNSHSTWVVVPLPQCLVHSAYLWLFLHNELLVPISSQIIKSYLKGKLQALVFCIRKKKLTVSIVLCIYNNSFGWGIESQRYLMAEF